VTGTLYLVGVGPGDPELLTLKAVRLIAAADVVAYPAANGETNLAFEVAREHVPDTAQRLPVDIPMCVDPGPAQSAYDALAKDMRTELEKGRNLVYLCQGDPLFYGSAINLIDRIAPLPVAIVPGVTSLTASAAVIGRPLAARNDILKVLPAPLASGVLERELKSASAAAIIKVGRHFDRVRDLLYRLDLAGDAMIVEHATRAEQRITPLAAFASNERPYFSTILCAGGADR